MKNKLLGLAALMIISPVLAFAQGYGWDGGWNGHMGFMGGNWGNQMGFFGGGLMMILWVIVLVAAIVALVRWIINPKSKSAATGNALSILAERYAKGEISQEEFIAMKKSLS